MKIDIERLHKRPKHGRQSGRTFDMVVELLQNITVLDDNEDVTYGVKVANTSLMIYIFRMMRMLSENFGITLTCNNNDGCIEVEGKRCNIIIHTTYVNRRYLHREYIEFVDHYQRPLNIDRRKYKKNDE